MKWKKNIATVCMGALIISSLSGCGSKTDIKAETSVGKESSESSMAGEQNTGEVTDIEVWGTNTGYLPVEKESELYNYYKNLIGVGVIQPYVEWNGGTTYQEQLNLRIAAGEMPDIFTPVGGMEAGLIESGALLDLTDLLPKYAPNLWNLFLQKCGM